MPGITHIEIKTVPFVMCENPSNAMLRRLWPYASTDRWRGPPILKQVMRQIGHH
jgi:hypothetical protein